MKGISPGTLSVLFGIYWNTRLHENEGSGEVAPGEAYGVKGDYERANKVL